MFSLHFNLCNQAINNRGVSVGKQKLFARSREDIADIRNFHAGNYCIPVFTSCILMQRNFFPEIFSLDPFLQKGSSLQVENLSSCLSVCLSSLQDFEYRPFISSQDHARPHISYTAGQRMMSAVIWRCQ